MADPSIVRLRIPGMLCAENCGARVQVALSQVAGVRQASVDFAQAIATVTLEKALTNEALSALVKAVKDVGYEVTGLVDGGDTSVSTQTQAHTQTHAHTHTCAPVTSHTTAHADGGATDGISANGSEANGLPANQRPRQLEIPVGGMTCQSCVRTVTQALYGVRGVEAGSLDVDLAAGLVKLHYSGNAVQGLRDAIEDAGYEAGEVIVGGEHLSRLDRELYRSLSQNANTSTREVGVELQLVGGGDPRTRALVNKARNALRSTPGVVCAAVDADAEHPTLIARVRVRTRPGQDAPILEAARQLGFEARLVHPKDAETRMKPADTTAHTTNGDVGSGGQTDTPAHTPSSSLAQSVHAKHPNGRKREPKKHFQPTTKGSLVGHMGDSTVVFDIKGMTCGACVATIETALKHTKGVVSAKVALLAEKAEVLFDSAEVQADDLKDAIENVGYDASIVQRVREDGLKANTAAFEVHHPLPPHIDTNKAYQGLFDALHAAEGVLGIEALPSTGSSSVSEAPTRGHASHGRPLTITVRYEPELVGLRDLVKHMAQRGYRARLLPPSSVPGGPSSMAAKQDRHLAVAKKRLVFALSLSVPITAISMVPHGWLPGLDTVIIPGCSLRDLLLLVLSAPVQFGCGSVFYREAYKGLKGGTYGMALLVAMGTTAAWAFAVFSLVRSIASHGRVKNNSDFFMTSVMLLSFILLGKYMEHAAKKRTSTALTKLMEVQAKYAVLLVVGADGQPTGEEERIPVELVQVGDVLKVIRGSKVPADGEVVAGEGFVDESLITGESLPVTKNPGDRVMGGSVNVEGSFRVRVTSVGEDSVLQQIIRLMEDAQMSKAPIQALADRIAGSFALFVLGASLVTFIVWLCLLYTHTIPRQWVPPSERNNAFVLAFTLAVSTMVVACPCAMGLATPTAIMVGTGVGASNGVLIKGGEALETAYRLSAVIFDKTGTLTEGHPAVEGFQLLTDAGAGDGGGRPPPLDLASHTDTHTLAHTHTDTHTNTHTEDSKEGVGESVCGREGERARVLRLVASAERPSEHPLARCIVKYATDTLGVEAVKDPTDFQAVSGKGLSCRVDGEVVTVGTLQWLQEKNVSPPDEGWLKMAKALEDMGKIVVWAGVGGKAAAMVSIADKPRPEAKQVLNALTRTLGLEVYMVTGDNRRTARFIAETLGVDPSKVMAETLPSNKVAKVRELQSRGHVVAMVGDGINDAPALAQADVGIAIGAGTDIATEAADMVLIKSDLGGVLTAIHLSRTIVRRIYLNLVWALLYNIIGIPMAAGLLMPILHTAIPPYIAGLAMVLSSVSVLTSSLALKWYKRPAILVPSSPRSARPHTLDSDADIESAFLLTRDCKGQGESKMRSGYGTVQ